MTETVEHTDLLKVGTNTLIHEFPNGILALDRNMFQRVASEVAGGDAVLISSAAIAAGMILTETTTRPDEKTDMRQLQYLGAVGQKLIYEGWESALRPIYKKNTAGILLTSQELDDEERATEAMEVIQTTLGNKAVPIINENYAIAHKEIQFGGNDILSARLAAKMQSTGMFGQIRLFLLSDVNGVYKDAEDPATRIPIIEDTAEYRHVARESHSRLAIGGMGGKFDAADIANQAGVDMWIYDPSTGNRHRAINGDIGTHFPAPAI